MVGGVFRLKGLEPVRAVHVVAESEPDHVPDARPTPAIPAPAMQLPPNRAEGRIQLTGETDGDPLLLIAKYFLHSRVAGKLVLIPSTA